MRYLQFRRILIMSVLIEIYYTEDVDSFEYNVGENRPFISRVIKRY